jgi:signal transduction histidine kinase
MTIRLRLIIVTVLGLVVTMAFWGWIQIQALKTILVEQQERRLASVAETVSSYYSHFPTGKGLSTLDATLKEQIQTDPRLARIDIFTVVNYDIDYIEYMVGAGRIRYDWQEEMVSSVAAYRKPKYVTIKTDDGPAIGLLHPVVSDKSQSTQFIVGVITFSRSYAEIMSRAQRLFFVSAAGLLLVILVILAASYRFIIDRPLGVIIRAINAFQRGSYLERIPDERRDEWGRLGRHFNAMAAEIEQVMAKNSELTGNLENRVYEETQRAVGLQKQVDSLQRLAAMGYLTATIAHDLGTPLHSIAGLASLLQERGNWPPDVDRKLELIIQQTRRLQAVIKKAKLAARPADIHFEDIDISEIISETVSLTEPLIVRAKAEIMVHCEKNLPRLHADRNRIQTALLNMIQNALEAMGSGGRITIFAGKTTAGNELLISVADNGDGIPPEILERIYEPFFSTREDDGFRGLGLPIVKDVAKIHGGRMDIASAFGEGTKVSLYFPLSL